MHDSRRYVMKVDAQLNQIGNDTVKVYLRITKQYDEAT